MSEVIEKLIDKTIDCDGNEVKEGDIVEIIHIKAVSNLNLTGLRGRVYTIKECEKNNNKWTMLSIQDIQGTVIGMFNYQFRRINND